MRLVVDNFNDPKDWNQLSFEDKSALCNGGEDPFCKDVTHPLKIKKWNCTMSRESRPSAHATFPPSSLEIFDDEGTIESLCSA